MSSGDTWDGRLVRHAASPALVALWLGILSSSFFLGCDRTQRQASRTLDPPADVAPSLAGASQTSTQGSSGASGGLGLTRAELAQGFRLMNTEGPDVWTFVHPSSPCWVEIPNPNVPLDPTEAEREGTARPATNPQHADLGRSAWTGPEVCRDCHAEQYAGFVQTAHFQTSAPASQTTVHGSFAAPEKDLATRHPDMRFEMLDRAGRLYQRVHFRDLHRDIPFDIVTGSGKTAQTYLFWEADRLYQMHVSYYRETDQWINSPGFHDGTAWYTREVIPKCVECHMTFVQWLPGTLNRFDRETTIYGVTCERCHGPGQAHVAFHQQQPGQTPGRYIANPGKLAPERANDVCSQCHLGSADPLQAPFSFRPGDRLDDYWTVHEQVADSGGQVHTANQLIRMQKSRCFTESEALTCISCHDPHRLERGDVRLFSQRCLECHQTEHCGVAETVGPDIADDCINCHMSIEQDEKIRLEAAEEIHMPALRDHYIRILPELSQRFLEARGQR